MVQGHKSNQKNYTYLKIFQHSFPSTITTKSPLTHCSSTMALSFNSLPPCGSTIHTLADKGIHQFKLIMLPKCTRTRVLNHSEEISGLKFLHFSCKKNAFVWRKSKIVISSFNFVISVNAFKHHKKNFTFSRAVQKYYQYRLGSVFSCANLYRQIRQCTFPQTSIFTPPAAPSPQQEMGYDYKAPNFGLKSCTSHTPCCLLLMTF